MMYFMALFGAIGAVLGGLKLRLVWSLPIFAIMSVAVAWLVPYTASEAAWLEIVLTCSIVLMTVMVACYLAGLRATGGKRQILFGFLSAVSPIAVMSACLFVGTFMQHEAPKATNERVRLRRDDIRYNGSDLRESDLAASQNLTNESTFSTNGLVTPKLELGSEKPPSP
jgi:hypothetical protein